ncbi:hypothetical protein KG112_12045 [Nocardioides sp. zg-ZUI104]|uniref:hypothetical protein n=1 Tax=Nocardioides faecalis TaxID=2803858 RepID=UPI001BCC86D8|nr:hypothetical protein [Nocardioides faecalis]MBS4753536.1 hypothetical protein [Nocardioides faecalis]
MTAPPPSASSGDGSLPGGRPRRGGARRAAPPAGGGFGGFGGGFGGRSRGTSGGSGDDDRPGDGSSEDPGKGSGKRSGKRADKGSDKGSGKGSDKGSGDRAGDRRRDRPGRVARDRSEDRPGREARERSGGRSSGPSSEPSTAPPPGPTAGPAAGRRGGPAYVTQAELTETFDAFYRTSRDRLLLQTFALTGDLTVARSAVREAYVVAWHHWRKISRLEDPEMSVRPTAWRIALRRRSTRPMRRRKDVDPQSRRTLDALGALPLPQRKALLLTQLAAVTMAEMAQEVALPLDAAERELQHGAARMATQLEIPTSAIPLALSSLAATTRDVTWPRVTIIRRAGIARRRVHTAVGATAAVVALVAGGAVAVDSTGARPALDREALPSTSAPPPASPAVSALPATALLGVDAVQRALPRAKWAEGATVDNSEGNGRLLPCQPVRYADPRGTAAWARTFRAGAANSGPTRTVTQFAEASLNERRASGTFRRTVRWFAGCPSPGDDPKAVPRIQLVSTASVSGIGDRAAVMVLRSRAEDATTYVIGVARTGLFTTTVSFATPVPPQSANRDGVVKLLAAAVSRMCALAGGGPCAEKKQVLSARDAFRTGEVPWLLSEVDLPPLSKERGRWVGTPVLDLTEDRADAGAIGCDTIHLFGSFRKQRIADNQYRAFVIDGAKLPTEFGITETVGSLPATSARAFVKRLREQIAACPDRDESAGTEVRELARSDAGPRSLSAWRLSTALPGDRTVEYDVAVVRRGGALALLVFVAAPRAQMAPSDFVALARRAGERLAEMPPYDAG